MGSGGKPRRIREVRDRRCAFITIYSPSQTEFVCVVQGIDQFDCHLQSTKQDITFKSIQCEALYGVEESECEDCANLPSVDFYFKIQISSRQNILKRISRGLICVKKFTGNSASISNSKIVWVFSLNNSIFLNHQYQIQILEIVGLKECLRIFS